MALLLAQPVQDQAWTAFAAIVAITRRSLPPALEGAQANADLSAGNDQTRTRDMGLADQFEGLAPVNGTGQPSASSEQRAAHFFRSTSKAAISAMAFCLRCSSFLRALISRWSQGISGQRGPERLLGSAIASLSSAVPSELFLTDLNPPFSPFWASSRSETGRWAH